MYKYLVSYHYGTSGYHGYAESFGSYVHSSDLLISEGLLEEIDENIKYKNFTIINIIPLVQ